MPELKPFLTTLAKTDDAIGVKRLPIIFLAWNMISFIFRDQDIVKISQTLELFYFIFSKLWTWISNLRFPFQKTVIAMRSELLLTAGKFRWW